MSHKKNLAAFLGTLLVSSVTMVLLFWRFPLTATFIAVGVFVTLGMSAYLARAIDFVDADMRQGDPVL